MDWYALAPETAPTLRATPYNLLPFQNNQNNNAPRSIQLSNEYMLVWTKWEQVRAVCTAEHIIYSTQGLWFEVWQLRSPKGRRVWHRSTSKWYDGFSMQGWFQSINYATTVSNMRTNSDTVINQQVLVSVSMSHAERPFTVGGISTSTTHDCVQMSEVERFPHQHSLGKSVVSWTRVIDQIGHQSPGRLFCFNFTVNHWYSQHVDQLNSLLYHSVW